MQRMAYLYNRDGSESMTSRFSHSIGRYRVHDSYILTGYRKVGDNVDLIAPYGRCETYRIEDIDDRTALLRRVA